MKRIGRWQETPTGDHVCEARYEAHGPAYDVDLMRIEHHVGRAQKAHRIEWFVMVADAALPRDTFHVCYGDREATRVRAWADETLSKITRPA